MHSKNIQYIIVQAGGKGSRLEYLTINKPKALVSINNAPIIFHLFNLFKSSHFIVCSDYKYDVMQKYLEAFADADYEIKKAQGTGTCAGLKDCLASIPPNTPFMLIWCDLVLNQNFSLSNLDIHNKNYLGLSKDFECRWKYGNATFKEEPSQEFGVAGLFIFKNKELLKDIPDSGEFVRWLSSQTIDFETIGLNGCCEYGLLKTIKEIKQPKCRPFNKITEHIIKEPITAQGESLATRERNWYQVVQNKNFLNLPHIYNLTPLEMDKIDGEPIYMYSDLSIQEKKNILSNIVDCLKKLHKLGEIPADKDSFDDNYIGKTLSRLAKVKELVPFAKDEYIIINGQKCKNFFYVTDKVIKEMDKYYPKTFKFIHGDCTFSNILLNSKKTPILIDPRGYFGKTELYGDIAYDWAKLYYSLISNYDQFNLKNFNLTINQNNVELSIPPNNWESLKDYYLDLIKDDVTEDQLNLILALIWLSLTTYAWDDYDSICGAFYQGTLILNKLKFIQEEK